MTRIVDLHTPYRPPDVPPLLPNPPTETPAMPPPFIMVREKPKWEYKRVDRNLAREEAITESELDEFGADGWELAGVIADSPLTYFYFKRLSK